MTFQCTAYLTHTHSNTSQQSRTTVHTVCHYDSPAKSHQSEYIYLYVRAKLIVILIAIPLMVFSLRFFAAVAVCACVDSLTTVPILTPHNNASHTLTLQDANMLRYHGNTQIVSIMIWSVLMWKLSISHSGSECAYTHHFYPHLYSE